MRKVIIAVLGFVILIGGIVLYSNQTISAESAALIRQFDSDGNGLINGQETVKAMEAWEVNGEAMLEIPDYDQRVLYLQNQTDPRSAKIFAETATAWLATETSSLNSRGKLAKELVRRVADRNGDGTISVEEGYEVIKFGQYSPRDLRRDAESVKRRN